MTTPPRGEYHEIRWSCRVSWIVGLLITLLAVVLLCARGFSGRTFWVFQWGLLAVVAALTSLTGLLFSAAGRERRNFIEAVAGVLLSGLSILAGYCTGWFFTVAS